MRLVEDTRRSDAELVAACRAGDHEAWCELVERFSRYVFAITQAFRLSEHDAEDVFQEVFARLYEHMDTLRSDEAVRPWIAQVARRQCIDRLRSGAREQPAEEDVLEVAADDRIEELNESFALHEALAALSESCQEILDRFFTRDESYRVIADALDLPPGTIASRISRCLARLREELREETGAQAGLGGR
jgi:RNA polymerase sigma-70 factor (ECF subfamily)